MNSSARGNGVQWMIALSAVAISCWLLEEHGLKGVLIFTAIALWYWTLRRGLLTVRSFMYLGMLTKGIDPMIANLEVHKIRYLDAGSIAPAAKYFVQQHYEGKQLAMIADARNQGFVG
jgi:hypothetical protein